MGFWEIFILAVGLAMDAFAVSVCKGLSVREAKLRHMLMAGIYFGGFQALMPVIGYFLGMSFQKYIVSVDHWIAFTLLVIIGGNMIRESFSKEEDGCGDKEFTVMLMLASAVATSIDALAVGVTFAFLNANIWAAAVCIGVITCLISMLGVKVGAVFGARFKSSAERAGGIILIAIGVKILLEHLGIIAF